MKRSVLCEALSHPHLQRVQNIPVSDEGHRNLHLTELRVVRWRSHQIIHASDQKHRRTQILSHQSLLTELTATSHHHHSLTLQRHLLTLHTQLTGHQAPQRIGHLHTHTHTYISETHTHTHTHTHIYIRHTHIKEWIQTEANLLHMNHV